MKNFQVINSENLFEKTLIFSSWKILLEKKDSNERN